MTATDPPGDPSLEDRVGRIADEFTDRLNDGQQPDLDEFVARHPDIGSTLREVLEAVRATRQPAEAPLPVSLGGCRVLREVGRGGMGVVYEAVQEPLGRRVALKVLSRQTGADPVFLERFRREARAAARLHHTNIVPVFGVGEQDGVHYYVMEFIDGQPLDRVIRDWVGRSAEPDDPGFPPHSFALAARAGLQAAEALAHAHEQGVLHRDVKPSNLLLDRLGKVWVADFGLAKVGTDTDLTATGDLVGTLRYLAPERLRGRVDARGDVCGLGLTLYELVVLRPAFGAADRHELVRQIGECAPARPRRLDPRVPRDLETIVLKAIAREPENRYASAAALADDLRCFLERRPIAARRASRLRQARLWCRRNPALSATAAAAVAILVGGLVAATGLWRQAERERYRADAQRQRAEARFETALTAVDRMLTQVGDRDLAGVPHMDETRRRLLEDALELYRGLLRDEGDDPALRAETARAYERMGLIHRLLGNTEQAAEAFAAGGALLQDLAAERPQEPSHRRGLVQCHHNLALLYADTRRPADAEASYREALRTVESLATDFPGVREDQQSMADILLDLGKLQVRARPDQAGQSWSLAEAALTRINPAGPDDYLTRFAWAVLRLHRGDLYREQNRRADAETELTAALALGERLGADGPRRFKDQHLVAAACNSLGGLYRTLERPAEALACYRRRIALIQGWVQDHPGVPDHQRDLAISYNNLGLFHRSRGESDQAKLAYEKAVALYGDLTQRFPKRSDYALYHATSRLNWAMHLAEHEKAAEALLWYNGVIESLEAVLAAGPNSYAHSSLHTAYFGRASTFLRLDRPADATPDWERVIDLGAGLKEEVVRMYRPRAFAHLGRHAQAMAEVESLMAEGQTRGWVLEELARTASLAATAALADPVLTSDDRGRLSDRYASRAVVLLTQAADVGFFRLPARVNALKTGSHFDPLRSRPDFQKLFAGLGSGATDRP